MRESIIVVSKPYDAEVIRGALEGAGYHVLLSEGDDDVEDRVEREHPAVVVLAQRLRRRDGAALLSQLRRGVYGAKVPVLLLTDAAGGIDGLAEAIEIGADDLLKRPLDGERVVERVASLAERPADDGSLPGQREVSSANSGWLADRDAAVLLAQGYRKRFTGRLKLWQGDATKGIFLDEGRPVYATSSLSSDRMGALLFREGRLDREQYEACRELVAGTGRRLGAILVDKGLIKPSELFPLVRHHIAEIIFSVFGWVEGSYQFDRQPLSGGERIRLDRSPPALILEGVRRKVGMDRLRERVGAPESTVVTLVVPRRPQLDELALPAADRQALAQLDGAPVLRDAIERGPLDALALYQLVYALAIVGILEARPVTDRQRRPSGGVPADGHRVRAKHAQVREGTYFAVLGLQPDASRHEVQRAYERLRQDFDPRSLAAEVRAELADELAAITEVIEEAYRILADDRMRAAYRKAL